MDLRDVSLKGICYILIMTRTNFHIAKILDQRRELDALEHFLSR
jgi:hypothetical protein